MTLGPLRLDTYATTSSGMLVTPGPLRLDTYTTTSSAMLLRDPFQTSKAID